MVSSRSLRIVLLVLGFFFLGVGFAGIVLPLVPVTGPVLLAAFFFSKSSERFDNWLVSNKYFGGIVRDWRAGVGFTVRAKVVAVAAIAVTFSITIMFGINSTVLRVLLAALAIAIATYVVTRPTKREASEPQPAEI